MALLSKKPIDLLNCKGLSAGWHVDNSDVLLTVFVPLDEGIRAVGDSPGTTDMETDKLLGGVIVVKKNINMQE